MLTAIYMEQSEMMEFLEVIYYKVKLKFLSLIRTRETTLQTLQSM